MINFFSIVRTVFQLMIVAIIAAIILIIPLKIVYVLTGNTAYTLLFNFDYVPILNKLKPVWLFGYVFHFITCICSVVGLFYILKIWNLQYSVIYYLLVYTIGGGALFFLTCLSNQPPAGGDRIAWLYWTGAHAIFGHAVAYMIQSWIDEKPIYRTV